MPLIVASDLGLHCLSMAHKKDGMLICLNNVLYGLRIAMHSLSYKKKNDSFIFGPKQNCIRI